MVQKEQEGRCLSTIPHSGSPSSTAFLQLCLLVLRLKVHLPPLACSEGHPQWGWGITFPCTLWFRCPGCKNTWIKVITLVIVI